MTLDFCKQEYNRRFPGDDIAPIGATEEEVQALEQRMGLTFPKAYRDFLLWMGNDESGILRDGHWFMKDIESNTTFLAEMLQSNGHPVPEGQYVSFYNYNGYVACWFLIPSATDDPLIYYFGEGDREYPEPCIRGTFTAWLDHMMAGSSVDTWIQFRARQRYEAALAAKNGGLNPDGTVFTPRTRPPEGKETMRAREELRQRRKAKAEAEAKAAAQGSSTADATPAQPT